MFKKRFIASLCAVSMLAGSAYAVSIEDFSDAKGHWAYQALSNAVYDGYLNGSDGKLTPDASLTTAQMAAILNRVLHTSDTSRVYPNIAQDQWYSNDANMAVSAGFLPVDGSLGINNNITRGEVFKALVNAFGLAEANPSTKSVEKFNDWEKMTLDQRRAAAVLVDKGILNGSDNGGLNPDKSISRAEFVTLVYRLLDYVEIHAPWNETEVLPDDPEQAVEAQPDEEVTESAEQTTEQTEEATEQTEETTEPSEQTEQSAAPILMFVNDDLSSLNREQDYNTIVLGGTSFEMEQSYWDKIDVSRLVINTAGLEVNLGVDDILRAETIVVGSGNGVVNLNEDLTKNVEITGSGRTINLSGAKLGNLIISGTNNTIVIDSRSDIENMTVQVCAENNIITVNGDIVNANINGSYTSVNGSGSITNTVLKGSNCDIADISQHFDNSGVDDGLQGIKLSLNTPKVEPGGDLVATVTMTGVSQPKTVSAQWYYEGSADSAFANSAMQLTEGKTSTYRKSITFTKNMKLWQNVKFVITYKNTVTEQIETLAITGDVEIENYPMSHYLPDASEVLAKVNPYYHSGNTDYTQDEKTVFVNAKGYSSKTQYLIWVSRSAQMVNVFEGSQWNWELIHEFQCATGKSSSPTPIGVTEVTYKQTGWYTSDYTCRPVVRFYPGTGYAFHSRLYYPGTNKLKDPSIGFPVSAGCVRMLDEGIYWLYDNVPSGTTVVIY